jgi:hypothetical protein
VEKQVSNLTYYDTPAASRFLEEQCQMRMKPTTLNKLRSVGGGPVFEYFSRFPMYREDWLRDYAASRKSGPQRMARERPRQRLTEVAEASL